MGAVIMRSVETRITHLVKKYFLTVALEFDLSCWLEVNNISN
jgi:hypothetical protein